jgi:hypothetical protein
VALRVFDEIMWVFAMRIATEVMRNCSNITSPVDADDGPSGKLRREIPRESPRRIRFPLLSMSLNPIASCNPPLGTMIFKGLRIFRRGRIFLGVIGG